MSTKVDPNVFISKLNYPYIRDIAEYEKLMKVGKGTFGEVFKARHRKSSRLYALKKVIMDKDTNDLPITSLREIKVLEIIRHENLLSLKEICFEKGSAENCFKTSLYLVLDFCEHDLAGLLSNYKVVFSLGELKKIAHMLFNGLYYLHYNNIIHRDIKSSNILVTRDGTLKLGDFGLARFTKTSAFEPQSVRRFTNRVVTLWYRAPELLLGSVQYDTSVDIWAAGCIVAELFTRIAIMQLHLIQVLCGSIKPSEWPEVHDLYLYNQLELTQGVRRCVVERLSRHIPFDSALDLIDKLLVYNPEKRLNADDALNHDFFWSDPMPTSLKEIMSTLTVSNYDMFNARNNEKRAPIISIPQGFISRYTPSMRGGPVKSQHNHYNRADNNHPYQQQNVFPSRQQLEHNRGYLSNNNKVPSPQHGKGAAICHSNQNGQQNPKLPRTDDEKRSSSSSDTSKSSSFNGRIF